LEAIVSIKLSRPIVAIAVILTLVIAGSASARVPKFKPLTIVPGKSIGGVSIGMSKNKAVGVWGKPDACTPFQPGIIWCQYKAASHIGGTTLVQPFAGFYLQSGKVLEVELESAENTAIDPKVEKLKTSKHIGVGTQMSTARSAYGIGPPSGGEAGLSRAMLQQGNKCTLFYAPTAPYTTVEAIQVGSCSPSAGLF
jgi:hypothetical protein